MDLAPWNFYQILNLFVMPDEKPVSDMACLGYREENLMKTYRTNQAKLLRTVGLVCLLSLFGCGSVITQQAAQDAVNDAQIAVQLARNSRADLYSAENLNSAERFLSEAQQSLLRNKPQRAHSLASRAEEAARLAEEDAKRRLQALSSLGQFSQPGGLPPFSTTLPPALPQQTGVPLSNLTVQEQSVLEMQRRVQAAAQALQDAQNTVQAARLLVLKVQTEIGLSMADATLQQVRESRASKEMIDLIQSWYEQARQAAALGNYENALYFLERAQAYAQDARTLAPKR